MQDHRFHVGDVFCPTCTRCGVGFLFFISAFRSSPSSSSSSSFSSSSATTSLSPHQLSPHQFSTLTTSSFTQHQLSPSSLITSHDITSHHITSHHINPDLTTSVASAALGAPQARFAWQEQHSDQIHRGERKSGDVCMYVCR